MRINHNIAALNTHRQLGAANNAQTKSMEKLSSGLRINSAADDAAGLAISEKMRAQVRGLDQASANSQDAISLIQTAEGALNETTSILQRMRELATQASTDTNTTSDRGEIQKEINSLTSEINRIGNTTEFNTQKLLNGEKDGSAAVSGVAGVTTLAIASGVALTSGQTVTIGGVQLTYTGATVSGNAAETALVALINANSGLSDKFTAAAVSGVMTITQNSGQESAATAVTSSIGTATLTTTGVAGKTAGTGASLQFQIGANENQSLTLDVSDMRSSALGITTAGSGAKLAVTDGTNNTTTEQALDVSDHASASAAITKIQAAIDKVSAERSKLGANQNRLDHTINNLGTSSENLTAAESRIRDVDMAKEMMNQTRESILAQASQAMLAQANQKPQSVLQLLQ